MNETNEIIVTLFNVSILLAFLGRLSLAKQPAVQRLEVNNIKQIYR